MSDAGGWRELSFKSTPRERTRGLYSHSGTRHCPTTQPAGSWNSDARATSSNIVSYRISMPRSVLTPCATEYKVLHRPNSGVHLQRPMRMLRLAHVRKLRILARACDDPRAAHGRPAVQPITLAIYLVCIDHETAAGPSTYTSRLGRMCRERCRAACHVRVCETSAQAASMAA